MKLMVAGGAGFIGSNFIHYMLEAHPDYEIINYDLLTYAGNLDNLKDIESNPRYHFEQGDITDLVKLNEIMQKYSVTHLINFAAETHVDRSIHGGIKDFVLTNSLGVQMLLDAVRANHLERMVNVSTDEVYGALGLTEDRKFTEDTPIMPNMPYAAAKAGGDLMCHAYHITHKTPVIVTHCSNNYGPYQYPEKLIPLFITNFLEGKKAPLYGKGENTREWIYVLDHCRAIDFLLHKGIAGEVYNIGSGVEKKNIQVADIILKELGQNKKMLEFVKDRPGHDWRYAVDFSKLKKLGWQPEYNFDDAMRETIRWYQKNEWWWKKLKSGEYLKYYQKQYGR